MSRLLPAVLLYVGPPQHRSVWCGRRNVTWVLCRGVAGTSKREFKT